MFFILPPVEELTYLIHVLHLANQICFLLAYGSFSQP